MLTRRTARFRELAEGIEARLASLGLAVDSQDIDGALRASVADVAQRMGVTDRTALGYAPDDLSDTIARDVVIAFRAAGADSQSPRRHLRVVR